MTDEQLDIAIRQKLRDTFEDVACGEAASKLFAALQNVLDVVGPGGPVDALYWIHGRLVAEAIAKALA